MNLALSFARWNLAHLTRRESIAKADYRRLMINGDPDDAESDAAFEHRQMCTRLAQEAEELVVMIEERTQ